MKILVSMGGKSKKSLYIEEELFNKAVSFLFDELNLYVENSNKKVAKNFINKILGKKTHSYEELMKADTKISKKKILQIEFKVRAKLGEILENPDKMTNKNQKFFNPVSKHPNFEMAVNYLRKTKTQQHTIVIFDNFISGLKGERRKSLKELSAQNPKINHGSFYNIEFKTLESIKNLVENPNLIQEDFKGRFETFDEILNHENFEKVVNYFNFYYKDDEESKAIFNYYLSWLKGENKKTTYQIATELNTAYGNVRARVNSFHNRMLKFLKNPVFKKEKPQIIRNTMHSSARVNNINTRFIESENFERIVFCLKKKYQSEYRRRTLENYIAGLKGEVQQTKREIAKEFFKTENAIYALESKIRYLVEKLITSPSYLEKLEDSKIPIRTRINVKDFKDNKNYDKVIAFAKKNFRSSYTNTILNNIICEIEDNEVKTNKELAEKLSIPLKQINHYSWRVKCFIKKYLANPDLMNRCERITIGSHKNVALFSLFNIGETQLSEGESVEDLVLKIKSSSDENEKAKLKEKVIFSQISEIKQMISSAHLNWKKEDALSEAMVSALEAIDSFKGEPGKFKEHFRQYVMAGIKEFKKVENQHGFLYNLDAPHYYKDNNAMSRLDNLHSEGFGYKGASSEIELAMLYSDKEIINSRLMADFHAKAKKESSEKEKTKKIEVLKLLKKKGLNLTLKQLKSLCSKFDEALKTKEEKIVFNNITGRITPKSTKEDREIMLRELKYKIQDNNEKVAKISDEEFILRFKKQVLKKLLEFAANEIKKEDKVIV